MIRDYEPGDLKRVLEIHNWHVVNGAANFEYDPIDAKEMKRRIEAIIGKYPYFVWEEDGEVVGYCYVHEWKQRAAYSRTVESTIYLHPDACGRGVGKIMMKKLIEATREKGYEAIIADITVGNEASERLHEKLGFKKVSHFVGVGYKFGRHYDVADYELIL